jgi:hypothetical protein
MHFLELELLVFAFDLYHLNFTHLILLLSFPNFLPSSHTQPLILLSSYSSFPASLFNESSKTS